MKRFVSLFFSLLLLTGCTAAPQDDIASPAAVDPPAEALRLRIVDGAGTEELLLAGENEYEVYTISTEGLTVYLDGAESPAEALEDGMPAALVCGSIEETYPARPDAEALYAYSLGTRENPGGSCYDLSGLYLRVLEDLWNKDAGLNGGELALLSLDLSAAPGDLTEGEKSAIAWRFAALHGLEPLRLGYAELPAQGYLTDADGSPYWENGILFSIREEMPETAEDSSLPALAFSAEKRRGAAASYGFTDCTAVWPELGTWSEYTVGAEGIKAIPHDAARADAERK